MDSWFPPTKKKKIGYLILPGFAAQYKGRMVKYEYLKKKQMLFSSVLRQQCVHNQRYLMPPKCAQNCSQSLHSP